MEDRALALRFAARTDVGVVRDHNEDSGYAGPYLLAVADGMGGMPAGDLASAIALQTIRRLDEPPGDDLESLLGRAVSDAKVEIARQVRDDPSTDGMGTTLTGTLFDGARIGLVHIGDSRGYLLRDGRFEQITRDHTFVQSLVDEGRITAEEARTHPHRAVVVRVLDGRQDGEADISVQQVRAGDRLLLCSDGLPDSGVEPDAIRRALGDARDPEEAAEQLVRLALEAGASDNVTCVVGEVVEAAGDSARTSSAAASSAAQLVGAATELAGSTPHGDVTADQEPVDEPAEAVEGGAGTGTGEGPGGDHGEGSGHSTNGRDPDEDEALRYAPQPPSRFRWLRRSLVTLVALAVVAGGVWAAYTWTQRQYFVAPYQNGSGGTGETGRVDHDYRDSDRVAIYQGISQQVPGIRLAHVYEVQPLELGALPSYQRRMLAQAISADGLADARAVVQQLRTVAEKCAGPTGHGAGRLAGPDTSTRRRGVAQQPQIPSECAGVGGAGSTPTPGPTPSNGPSSGPSNGPSSGPSNGPSRTASDSPAPTTGSTPPGKKGTGSR